MEELERIPKNSTTEGIPVAPSLSPCLASAQIERRRTVIDQRVVVISCVAMVLGLAAGFVAQLLIRLIGLITNISFFGRFSFTFVTPVGNTLGAWVILVPAVGGIIVGLMARYGSQKIRGHGIPEAMEQVLFHESKIPARMTFLKPLSAAISIGTGGPFGAEGPIIATGGALGSLFGQFLETTAVERKTLLAAGAAAGLTATFGNPVSSVLLAIELLLFEFSPRSFVPCALACSVAAAVRIAFAGTGAAFVIPHIAAAGATALAVYFVIGALIGVVSVWVTDLISWIERQFQKIPIHWMWHPAIGGLVVGLIGWKMPQTMGPGYDTIESIVGGHLVGSALIIFFIFKLISWSTSVGSGTSGGTLAPMFAMGGCLGGAIAAGVAYLFPGWGVSPEAAALVGMAAIFAGASRAFLASVTLAFETTHQFQGLLPLLAGCSAAFLVSGLLMKYTIMTEKFVHAGVRVPEEYVPDMLTHVHVSDAMVSKIVILQGTDTIGKARTWFSSNSGETQYQGYPVVDAKEQVLGFVLRRELMVPGLDAGRPVSSLVKRPVATVASRATLQEALDIMSEEDVGRLLVVEDYSWQRSGVLNRSMVHGILTRSDIHEVYHRRLTRSEMRERTLRLRRAS